MTTPEALARQQIDRLLAAAGWAVHNFKAADIHAARGVAIREFQLNPGFGEADYLLYVDGKAAGVIEAKKQGATLTGVEVQSGKYAQGLPASLPAWRRPLPFVYESTGAETHFTNALDPEPRARTAFAFHRPETLAEWLGALPPLQGEGREVVVMERFGTDGALPPVQGEGRGGDGSAAAHEAPASTSRRCSSPTAAPRWWCPTTCCSKAAPARPSAAS
jgi:hypothetical protein